MMRPLRFAAATALVLVAGSDLAFADAAEQREYESRSQSEAGRMDGLRGYPRNSAYRNSNAYQKSYDENFGKGFAQGGEYYNASQLAIHNLNNSGSGADTSYGGSYDQGACCTFAPGELPQGNVVISVTLPEAARGVEKEGVEVWRVSRLRHLYPEVWTYRGFEALLAQVTDRFGASRRDTSRPAGPVTDGRRADPNGSPR